MLIAALRDLQWRRRRFAVAVVGTALVFAMTLVLTGISAGFTTEANRTVDELGVDGWLVAAGATGPFLGAAPLPSSAVEGVRGAPGVRAAAPFVFSRRSIATGGAPLEVNVIGLPAAGPGFPRPAQGRLPTRAGEVAISTELRGYGVGDTIAVTGTTLRVVGEVRGSTALAGVPTIFVTLADAQAVTYAGRPIASALVFEGALRGPPPQGLVQMSNGDAKQDMLRALAPARQGLTLTAVLLWVVAATIIGSVIYLSALDRLRDFAVFKATGVSSRSIMAGLALQAVTISLAAAGLGSVVATALAPRFPLPVSIGAGAHALLPVLAVVVGLAASTSGLRRAVTVDPALAFGGP